MRPWLAIVAGALLALPSPASADVRVFETEGDTLPALSLDLFGWVQPRFSFQQSDERPQVNFTSRPAFSVSRARLGAIGHLGQWARAQLELELAREVAQPVDAFLVLTPLARPEATLNLTLGQFRVPFSRQNTLRSQSWQLPDPAYWIASKFVVERDIGGDVRHEPARGEDPHLCRGVERERAWTWPDPELG